MTEFSLRVIKAIKKVPKGRVATYGQIAKWAGNAQAARGVSWILNSSSKAHKLPWHRIISAQGRISFPRLSEKFARQKRLLMAEGVEVSDTGAIDLTEFGLKKI